MFKSLASIVGAVALGLGLLGAGAAHAQGGPAVLGGGSGIVIDKKFECTLTTIGNDNLGRLVGLTAGHCGNAGASVVAEANTAQGQVGTIRTSNPDLDYAVIEFNRDKVIPVNRVGNVTITHVADPTGFPNIICKEGRTTGNTCGVAWGDVFQTGVETWSQMCVIEGDSGAPVVFGTALIGMVNAYLLVPCAGPEVGTNMNAILGDINANGGVGAGFQPI